MKGNVKRQYQELVEYIEYPTVVYIYETGRIVAYNTYAKEIMGQECKNMNAIWDNQSRMKLPKDVLNGGSEIYYNRTISVGNEKIRIDMEINSLSLDNGHVIICFFEQSYKEQYANHLSGLIPRIMWKNKKLILKGSNYCFKKDFAEADNYENKRSEELFEPITSERIQREEEEILQTLESRYGEIQQLTRKDGVSFYVKSNRMPMINKNGTCMGILCVYKLILNRDELRFLFDRTLRENNILNEVMKRSDKIVLSCGVGGDWPVEYISSNFEKYGYQLNYFYTKKITWKDVIHPEDYLRISNQEQNTMGKGQQVQEYRILTAEGKSVWVTDETIAIVKHKKSLYRECIISEMGMERGNIGERYSMESYRDYLTSLPNRLKLEYDIFNAIERAIENNGYGYMVFFDLDDFKKLNDELGHDYGDLLLKNVARLINGIPQLKDSCYRVGGDKFCIIIWDEYAKEADQLINQLFEGFRKPWRLYGKEYYCTMSMGIVKFPTDSTQPTDLFRYAELAQTEAKKEGKNQVSYFEPRVEDKSVERINMESYLRKAITSDCYEFEVFYQPIVESKDKTITSGEALLRWRSPELGFVNPLEFLPLSEYLGLIVPLGEFVLREAFVMCKNINDRIDPTFNMNINLSVVQLIQPNIVARIMEIARKTGVRCSNIVFEVTESLAIEDMELLKTVLTELKLLGFSIALDGFGTGYSSLNHIMEIPLDYIKIDKSFISQYGKKKFNPSLLNAITELAHSINVQVVVEGVETKQQMEFLAFVNSDKYQGFLYGKPVSKDEFVVNFLIK